ncbi:sigma-54 dependent transcriptional regulator [Kangiella marina]|uniref:Two-component system response regulator PilR n=1 Tax=Kangiella marina TaxID=1079178 RepID=A0ABP8IRB5_9GAMM
MSESQPKVIIIDDEADIRHLLTMTLVQMKLDVVSCKNISEAKSAMEEQSFNFCLTDLKLPDGNGLDLVRYTKKHYPHMPIAVITAYSTTEKAIEAMKLGAFDFLSKPIDLNHLRQLLKHAFKFSAQQEEPKKEAIYKVFAGDDTYATSLRKNIAKVKGSQAPVVIIGEPGTEKEGLAKVIHQQSSRANNALVFLDLEAHDASTLEKLLFHNDQSCQSFLSRADEGTLVISNLHLLTLPLQKRLLQSIEDKSYSLGDDAEPAMLDIRLIVCTETDLCKLVKQGQLREDLYFRINVINLTIPPLRERKNDLEAIANSYLEDFRSNKSLSPATLKKLLEHDFNFNYREMENALLKACTLSSGEKIEPEDLILMDTSPDESGDSLDELDRGNQPLDQFLEAIERREIEKALEYTRWNRTEAAKHLQISFRTIRYKMKKLGIQ